MIASPFLPYFPSEAARGVQDGIASVGARPTVLPWLGVPASWNDCFRASPRDGLMAALRVVSAVATDARDGFVIADLVEQARQHRRVAGAVVGHFDGPDFQCGRVNAQVNLAPLTPIVSAMLLRFPLALAKHLDAGAVDQQMQSRRRRTRLDRHRQMLLAPADGAEVGNLPVQTGQSEQALRHAHRLPQGQIEQALHRQAELNRRFAVFRAAAPPAAGDAVPAHVLVQPNQQRAARSQRFVVFLPVGRSVFRFGWCTHPVSLPVARLGRCGDGFVQQSPLPAINALLHSESKSQHYHMFLSNRFERRTAGKG